MKEPSNEDVQRFNRWSRTYDRSLGQPFFFVPVHAGVIALVSAHLDGQAALQVLDIGCGTGQLLRRAVQQWPKAHFVGVDPAESMIKNARRLAPSVTFHVGRGEALPLPDASSDLAFSTVSFHHWGDQAAGVREVARVLRPGGMFCLADITIPSFAARLIPHTRMHTPREMRFLFEQAGLSVVSQKNVRAGVVLATIGKRG
jgi:ubiquinone/menaquinone biosynthesis C-methylase UbiE